MFIILGIVRSRMLSKVTPWDNNNFLEEKEGKRKEYITLWIQFVWWSEQHKKWILASLASVARRPFRPQMSCEFHVCITENFSQEQRRMVDAYSN